MAATKTAKKRTSKGRAQARKVKGFSCPDCDFVAKHAMGLGRHRSTRHGVVSQRQTRRMSSGNWITRQEAAKRAAVHYNTVRQWEQAGLLGRTKRPHVRGALVSAEDLARILADRARTAGVSVPAAAGAPIAAGNVAALEARFELLVGGLEQLLASVRASGGVSRGGRAKAAAARKLVKKATAPKKKTAKKATRRTR